MPLYDYLCLECGKVSEILVAGTDDSPRCQACGSGSLKRLLSAHAAISGVKGNRMPGPGDTACCGSSPGMAQGCAGPGSCCGRGVRP